MLDETEHQRSLLGIYRRNAKLLLRQCASFGSAQVPLHIEGGLTEVQTKIAEIKQDIRRRGHAVDDLPEDAPTPSIPVGASEERVRLCMDVTLTDLQLLKEYAEKVGINTGNWSTFNI